MTHDIVPLPREQWRGQILPIGYTTNEYYDVVPMQVADGFQIAITRRTFDTPVTHTPEEYDFPDRLYEDCWDNARAWGIVTGGTLMAAIETAPEKWFNRLRVTELWVHPSLQKQGVGHALITLAKQQARDDGHRAVILETQSCNVGAIGFYLHEGFTLIGFDSCCYTNSDLQRKEVRMELGWFPA